MNPSGLARAQRASSVRVGHRVELFIFPFDFHTVLAFILSFGTSFPLEHFSFLVFCVVEFGFVCRAGVDLCTFSWGIIYIYIT